MQIQRKRTSLRVRTRRKSRRKRRPSDPKIVAFAMSGNMRRLLESCSMLFVRHMAMGSKTIGKCCSDFLTHRFWNKGRCLKKPDACRIMTIRSTVKEKEPPRSRRVFSQAVRPLLIVVTRLFFEPAVAKAFVR